MSLYLKPCKVLPMSLFTTTVTILTLSPTTTLRLTLLQTGHVTVSQTLACSSVRDFPLANLFACNAFPSDIWMVCSVTILLSLLFTLWHSEILYILLLTFYYPSSQQNISSLRARNFICLTQEFSKCLEEWLAHILLNRYLSEWMNELASNRLLKLTKKPSSQYFDLLRKILKKIKRNLKVTNFIKGRSQRNRIKIY